jgi:hypothetical protein
MAIMEAKAKEATGTAPLPSIQPSSIHTPSASPPRRNKTDVLVTSIGPNLLPHRMRLCASLWAVNIKAEFPYTLPTPNFTTYLQSYLWSLATPKTPSFRSS